MCSVLKKLYIFSLQTQNPLAGIFKIDKPVNVYINVINTVEKDILKELNIFDNEAKENTNTNATTFEEVNNVTSFLSNDTINNNEIEKSTDEESNINADRAIQIKINKQRQDNNSRKEGRKSINSGVQ